RRRGRGPDRDPRDRPRGRTSAGGADQGAERGPRRGRRRRSAGRPSPGGRGRHEPDRAAGGVRARRQHRGRDRAGPREGLRRLPRDPGLLMSDERGPMPSWPGRLAVAIAIAVPLLVLLWLAVSPWLWGRSTP